MPDSPSKKSPSIPSWQQRPANTPVEHPPSSDDAAPSTTAATMRQDRVDQASRFLQDESIRDAPTDRKISFLETKGLTSDEIQELLGVSRNAEANSTTSPAAAEEKGQDAAATSPPLESTTNDSSQPSPQTSSSPSDAMSQQRSSTPTTTATSISTPAPNSTPPIITYPEFLFQQSKPPPLVTMRSILYTLYGAAGLGASIYGASEYFVKPMLASLTSARHELATTAQENLQKLNEKLEQSVSVIPPQLTAPKAKTAADDSAAQDDEADTSSVISDPTELFHRDVATQTSPEYSATPLSSASTDILAATAKPTTAVTNHISHLESIQSQLQDLVDTEKETSSVDDSMRSRLTDLHHYLDGLIYNAPAYTVAAPSYGVYSGNLSSGVDGSATGVRKSEDDAIASFKTEIRGVKGALLSARNFPATRGGRLPGAGPAGVPAVGK